jgi:hypothetical protein
MELKRTFFIKLPESVKSREEALEAFEEMRKQASDVPEMSLDEINEEIRNVRQERKFCKIKKLVIENSRYKRYNNKRFARK